ncbi:MAG: hypothetical protein JW947_02980 [Sedimentisphaerales bacterium]|nr:hypothetical protein [Sedimentisphaerales bacterium]
MTEEHTAKKNAAFGEPRPLIQKTELIAGAIISLITILLHLAFMRHAGAFWRDEVNSINLATMPTVSDIWRYLNYDAFPALLPLILRFWANFGTGSELWLRVFGFLTGVCILGTVWLNGRLLGYRVPLLSIALFAFNPLSVQIGDAIRPYGVGIFLMLLTFGILWKVTQEARLWQVAAGVIVMILSVQCLYQNAFFILAAVSAGVIITLRDKRWKRAALLATMGIISASSLLPYRQILKNSRDWSIIMKGSPMDFQSIRHDLFDALNASGWTASLIWTGLLIAGTSIYLYFRLVRSKPAISKMKRDVTLFCVTTLAVYSVLFLIFLRFVSVTTRVWYYLPLMAVAAMVLDVIFSNLNLLSILRIAAAILAAATTLAICWETVHIRQTNVDIAALTLEKSAGANDLIVVNPWYLGVSFQRYYHGTAPWITIPPIEDHKVHRYDLIKAEMSSFNHSEPVLSEISKTLKSGGTVWVIGWISGPSGNNLPESLPPAPESIYGWSERAYRMSWEKLLVNFITAHSRSNKPLPPLTEKSVNSFEDCHILTFMGWR